MTRASRRRRDVHGTVEPGYESVARAFGQTFSAERRGGGALVVQDRGRAVVDIWVGWADRARTRPWTRDTPAMSFSTTKGVTATVLHRLADRGVLDYDAPVAEYWPEFAAGGKGQITVRQLMSHQAGLYDARSLARSTAEVLDHRTMEDRLAAAGARQRPGQPYYHALTYGWLCAGLARSITGQGMAELFQVEVAEPLGLTGIHLGRPRSGERAAEFVGSLRPLTGLATQLMLPIGATRLSPASPAVRALFPRGMFALLEDGGAPMLETEMPAANGVFTAGSLATLYAAMANGGSIGGHRLLSPETVHAAGRLQARKRDGVLAIPMGWRLGYHHAMTTHRRSRRGFGHYGLGGSGGFGDPDTGLSFGFVTNRLDSANLTAGNLTTLWLADVAIRSAARAR